MPMLQLILGGARSGKSRFAERLASESGNNVVYLATATAGDEEMAARIDHHRRQRPADWQLCEEPVHLAHALQSVCTPHATVLVDCLTLWLTNVLFHDDAFLWQRERDALMTLLPTLPGQLLLVSNEIGQGIVPLGAGNRRFVDELGWLHQDIAQLANKAWFVIAGLPQLLKDTPP
jgi:adenosylcobinamide kinase/adenosylcobinamide-phosphate guanylyltransferase